MTDAKSARPLMAILRGVRPDEAVDVGKTLVDAGIELIEVTTNSPNPFESISMMISAIGDAASIGAGTVTDVSQVDQLAEAGGQFVVSPDCNPAVIGRTKEAGMLSYPGVFTPSECFTALRSGADTLKIFPAFLLTPTGLNAIRATLPADTNFFAVGGIDAPVFKEWLAGGVHGFGIGSSIYKPGKSLSEIKQSAMTCIAAYDQACAELEAS